MKFTKNGSDMLNKKKDDTNTTLLHELYLHLGRYLR